MFVNSHIASGYIVGKIINQDPKWILLLIFSTVLPDIDGLLLPKFLENNMTWDHGTIFKDRENWIIESNKSVWKLDSELNLFGIYLKNNSRFKFELIDKSQLT